MVGLVQLVEGLNMKKTKIPKEDAFCPPTAFKLKLKQQLVLKFLTCWHCPADFELPCPYNCIRQFLF